MDDETKEFYFTFHIGVSAKTGREAIHLLERFLAQTHDKDGKPSPICSAQREE